MTARSTLALFALLAALVGCGRERPAGSRDERLPPGVTFPDDRPVENVLAAAPDERTHRAALSYVEHCSACHGDWGEGQTAPSLWDTDLDRDALVQKIDATMPPKNPALCAGECAELIADFILTRFAAEARACEGIVPAPRQLRVLNRREYANTVRTLLGVSQNAAPGTDQGDCRAHTFRFPSDGREASVHVAGTFNAWSDTAWPMSYSSSDGAWTLRRELDEGRHEFKYVVRTDSGGALSWHADPALGGTGEQGNSVLTIACDAEPGGTDTLDFSRLPVETRPIAFAFDSSTSSAIGAQELEAYLETAKRVAATLTTPATLASCDLGADREGCARSMITTFGKRAFRRPLTDAETDRYVALVRSEPDALEAARTLLTALLMSPSFLYRSELGVEQPDGTFLLTPHEVASALSYTLTGNMPDDALMAAADAGGLQTVEDIGAHARRLVQDGASRGSLSTFVLQWLGVTGVAGIQRDAALYPEFTPDLARAMLDETRTFVEHVLFEGEGTTEQLLGADYSFVNAALAPLYGMSGELGSELVKTPYPDALRAGVLGHASVLATFAHAEQTSPVLRGLFVRRQLMCQRFGEPPPEAGAVPVPDPTKSTRERFDMHSQASCASCHQHIDGLGFGFERFDSLGRYRESEGEHPIDANGEITGLGRLGDGTKERFDSPHALSEILLASEATHSCVAKQSFRFARGALDNGLSYCAAKLVYQRYEQSGHKLLEALLAAVESVDFRYRY